MSSRKHHEYSFIREMLYERDHGHSSPLMEYLQDDSPDHIALRDAICNGTRYLDEKHKTAAVKPAPSNSYYQG
jgi:hypothetical protein